MNKEILNALIGASCFFAKNDNGKLKFEKNGKWILFDPANNCDAMHEAIVRCLCSGERDEFVRYLKQIIHEDIKKENPHRRNYNIEFYLSIANFKQLSEAFLRTKRLWNDSL